LRLTGAAAFPSADASADPSGDLSGPVGFSEGAARLKDFMLSDVGVSPDSFVITNGSGLYGANVVSAQAVVKLISWILSDASIKESIRAALPVGGRDGTLKNRFKEEPLKNRVRAKTGTLDEAVSLAGWVEMPDGRELSFAVLVEGDSKLEARQVRKAVDQSVLQVFQSLDSGGGQVPGSGPDSSALGVSAP
jgi:D-alanyl-D-alanine carboxypeptidase/D-alanyl-D-alanine-endopeptidase (penicillin-binding protein 4)